MDPDDDDVPLVDTEAREDRERRREFLARVRLHDGPLAIVVSSHVTLGPYVLSAECPIVEISLAEARQFHDALAEAIAAYEVRTLAELDTEPEPYLTTREESPA